MNRKSKLYRCFCCFHVRQGALALGTWHLMVHLFAISLIAYMSCNLEEINSSVQSLTVYIRRARVDDSLATSSNNNLNVNATTLSELEDHPIALPVSLQRGGAPINTDSDGSNGGERKVIWYWTSYVYTYAGLSQPEITQHDLNGAFVIGCLVVAISTMMIAGIMKGKPAYMFPFLGYQLGDLFVSSLTVAGVICLGPNIKQFLLSGEDFPFRQEVEQVDNQWIVLSVAIGILAVIFVKAYFVQVVWLSIRYLREESLQKAREACQPKVIFLDGASSGSESADTTLFMFDNEGAIIKKSPPPPAYDVAGDEKVAPPAYTI